MPTPTPLQRMLSMGIGWHEAGDPRCIFAEAYGQMTERMMGEVSGDRFADPEWVSRLLEHFADYYFIAADRYASGRPDVPEPWRIAFDAARRSELNVLQHLFLGINAHINHDLVFTVVDLLDDEWVSLPEQVRQLRRRDYTMVNDVIEATIGEVQDTVVAGRSPWLSFVDDLLGPIDEWFFAHLIGQWREDVWSYATTILESEVTQRESTSLEVVRTAVDRSHLFLFD